MTEDLSQYHHPLTDLFPAGDWRNYQLTADQVNFYNEHGYLSGIKMLDDTQLDALRSWRH